MGERIRIGQLLVDAGRANTDQIHDALRNQIISGGRLGTNLAENSDVNLDDVSVALAEQHGLPPTLGSHFDDRDARLDTIVSPELAAKWLVIPLYLAGDTGDQVVIASADPLSPAAVEQLQGCFGLPIINGIAPELRIFYWLERLYGIQRVNRFKRARRSMPPERTDERRGFVDTLKDTEVPTQPGTLARIAVRRLAVPVASEGGEEPTNSASIDEVRKSLRRAGNRGRVADLVVSALRDGFGQRFDAALLLFVRENTAMGWRGFIRGHTDDASVIESVAVPLEHPSLLATVCNTKAALVGKPESAHELDRRMFQLIGARPPAGVAALPIALFDEIVAVVYAQSALSIPDDEADALRRLAESVEATFQRLVNAASR